MQRGQALYPRPDKSVEDAKIYMDSVKCKHAGMLGFFRHPETRVARAAVPMSCVLMEKERGTEDLSTLTSLPLPCWICSLRGLFRNFERAAWPFLRLIKDSPLHFWLWFLRLCRVLFFPLLMITVLR